MNIPNSTISSTWHDGTNSGTVMASAQKRTAMDFLGLSQQEMGRTACWDRVLRPQAQPSTGSRWAVGLAEPGRCSKPRGAAGTRQAGSSRWRLPPSFGGWKPRPCHSGLKPGGGAGDGRLGRPVQGSPARKPHPPGPQTPAGRSLAAAALRRAARREARGGAVWRYDGSGCAARPGQRRAHARPRRHFGGPARW